MTSEVWERHDYDPLRALQNAGSSMKSKPASLSYENATSGKRALPGDTLDINPALHPTWCIDIRKSQGVVPLSHLRLGDS